MRPERDSRARSRGLSARRVPRGRCGRDVREPCDLAFCVAEFQDHRARDSHSKAVFLESLRTLVPELQASDLADGPVGVRAQAMRADGSLVEDFSFVEETGVLHVINAPSPAATASLAIGEHIAAKADALFGISGRGVLTGDAA